MNTLYLDCSMGAAGDMLTAALLELLPDRAGFLRRLNSLGLPGVAFRAEPGRTLRHPRHPYYRHGPRRRRGRRRP